MTYLYLMLKKFACNLSKTILDKMIITYIIFGHKSPYYRSAIYGYNNKQ